MKPEEIVELIQFYRHDILNELQVIQGYAKLGKLEKVRFLLDNLFQSFHNEREFMLLNIPHVFLWFFQYKHKHPEYKLTYSSTIKNLDLAEADVHIKHNLEQIMQVIEEKCSQEKIYSIHLAFEENGNTARVNVSVNETDGEPTSISLPEDINISRTEEMTTYSFRVSTS